ncbi:MAG: hypothetical protein CME71_12950 [Halobacteriovorax sp.]|nr:hypothetical protein [Halobacteriovorax sp.]
MQVRIIGGHGGVSPGFKATSYLIDGKLLIDASSVASGLPINEQAKIEHILISHSHLDHISDLAFLSDNCFGMKGVPFEIYTSPKAHQNIMAHLLNDEIWPDFTKLPSKENPTLRFHEITSEQSFNVGAYKITPVEVNHPAGGHGFIVENGNAAVVFTQDTGPTDRIWEISHTIKNLKGIFTEVSFPNDLMQIAINSFHHTPSTMNEEIKKMPKDIPIFLGHLKPNFQTKLFEEIAELKLDRVSLLGSDDSTFIFR